MTRVAVVGAGWSGLACALTLAERGTHVALIDAAPQAGGRARAVDVALGDASYTLDNGQHLLVGAYRETLRLIARIGLDANALFLRMPFALVYPDGFELRARRLPAPWHLAAALATARGLHFADRASIVRDVRAWRRRGWRADDAASAPSTLRHATPIVVRRVWDPLCLAALNVPLADASAQIFLNVLRDSLGAGAGDSDLLLPRRDLSAVFPGAAVAALRRAGGDVILRGHARALRRTSSWWVDLGARTVAADAVVLALPPERAAALLASAQLPELAAPIATLEKIDTAAIATAYLRYPSDVRLPAAMIALIDDPAAQDFGQWAFDRGLLDADCAGVVAVVISGNGPHLELGRDALCRAAARQLSAALKLPSPIANHAIVEKRATIQPVPGLRRPPTKLPVAGLFLAGDAADSPYPSTLEGSVRAGIAAAHAVLSA